MSWASPPLPVIVNGIALFDGPHAETVEDTITSGLVEHAYPGRDGADLEPVGLEARRVTISGVIKGATWLSDLAVLTAAVSAGGSHTLVHPQRGLLTGRIRSLSVTHRDEEHSLARVRIEFVEGRLVSQLAFLPAASLAASAAAVRSAASAASAAAAALE